MGENINVKDILKVTNGKLIYGNENEICANFCKDTALINKDDIFVGIKGTSKDGGTFYKDAFEKGAKGCIINKGASLKVEKIENKFLIEVEDTVLAIQQIATLKRKLYNIPVIAVTGSVGKTSTKDIIASVLSEKYKVLKTQGNMNNHIGLPFTILGLKDHTAMVVEMGMNHLGEIRTLTNIARPTIAVITNVGTAHIGNLGSRENILKAKLEIIEGLQNNGHVIINNDNDLLHKWYEENRNNYNIYTYGINNKSIEMAEDIEYLETNSNYNVVNNNKKTKIEVPVGGEAFIYNSLAAISVGRLLEIDISKIKAGIKKFELTQMRLDISKSDKGYLIINDCYNANYDSMKSAIEYLARVKGKRKIAVLGDMLELGNYSEELHKKVGEVLVDNKIDILVAVGEMSKKIAQIAIKNNIETYEKNNNKTAIEQLNKMLIKDDVVLIKASNSMNFEEIYNAIK